MAFDKFNEKDINYVFAERIKEREEKEFLEARVKDQAEVIERLKNWKQPVPERAFPELPPPPSSLYPDIPPPPPLTDVEEVILAPELDPMDKFFVANMEKKYFEARLAEVQDSGIPIPEPELSPEEEEEFDQKKIREKARKLAPNALKSLEEIVDKKSPFHKEATPAQIIRAAEIILNYAGDRPAMASPDDGGKTKHFAILDKSVMPTKPNNKSPSEAKS